MYRLGQTSPVTIWKLIALGTVEEQILLMQKEKLKAADVLFHLSFLERGQEFLPEAVVDFKEEDGFVPIIENANEAYLQSEFSSDPIVKNSDNIWNIVNQLKVRDPVIIT